MRARVAWMGGIAAASLIAAIGGCRGLAGVEDAYLVGDAGLGGASQGGSAGSSNGGTAGSAEGGTGQGGTGAGGTGQGGSAGSCGMLTDCDGQCVDTSMDRKNCGGCGKQCPDDEVCGASTCVSCAPSEVCGNECADIKNDPKNCGACGQACLQTEQCVNGACLACPTGQIHCSVGCIDPNTDPVNCGWCDHNCGTGCDSGACTAETVVQTEGTPTSLATDGSLVYWTDALEMAPWGRVQSSSYPGNIEAIIVDAGTNPQALSVEAGGTGRLAWASKTGAGWNLHAADGQSKTELFSFPIDGDVFQSIVHDGRIFWTKNGGTTVQRLEFDGTGLLVLNGALDMPFGLVGHDIFVYAATQNGIARLNANSAGSQFSFAENQGRPRFVARAGDRLVWDNSLKDDIRMRKIDMSDGPEGEVICGGFQNLRALVAIDDVVYFSAFDKNQNRDGVFAVRAMPKSVARPLAWTSTSITSMAVDTSYVYWGGLDKTIMRVTRGSTPP